MDKFIYSIGNGTCSFMDLIGLDKLKSMIGCNSYDNYTIGLFTILFLIVLMSGGGFFGFFGDGKDWFKLFIERPLSTGSNSEAI